MKSFQYKTEIESRIGKATHLYGVIIYGEFRDDEQSSDPYYPTEKLTEIEVQGVDVRDLTISREVEGGVITDEFPIKWVVDYGCALILEAHVLGLAKELFEGGDRADEIWDLY